MSNEMTAPRSRRALLAAAAGAAAATLVSAIERPASVRAGTDGDVVLGDFNETTKTTEISNSSGGDGFRGTSGGNGAADGVVGLSSTGVGVFGGSRNGATGTTHRNQIGVRGWASHEAGTSIGVLGDSYAGIGVKGESGSGTGVLATSTTGTALDVVGKAKFSRSGKVKMAKGATSYTKTVAGVTTSSLIFAVLQSYRSGTYVAAVVPHTGYFNVRLNKALSADTYVSWFVVN